MAISESTKKALRTAALTNSNWSQIAKEFDMIESTVRHILAASYSWTTTKCRQCGDPFDYRFHVDHPRFYRRCSRCAAKEWDSRLRQSL